jgi:predicted outer membrane repeat protein
MLLTQQRTNTMHIKRLLTSIILGLGITLALIWTLADLTIPAYALTYTVTNANDSGPGSLREALDNAEIRPGHDTIVINANGTVTLQNELRTIEDDLTIVGPGADQFSVSGDNQIRVFSIGNTATVTITGITIRDGNAAVTLYADFYEGGGVYISSGSLVLSDTQVISNTAVRGGGIYANGDVTLIRTQIFSNFTYYRGGGIYQDEDNLTLIESQVANNTSTGGGGLYISARSVTLSRTEIISNSVHKRGGGIYLIAGTLTAKGGKIAENLARNGGGIFNAQGPLVLSETQVISNAANERGGGIYHNSLSEAITLTQTTLAGNSAQEGGGIYARSESSLHIEGGQVADNSATHSGGGLYIDGTLPAGFVGTVLSGTQITANDAITGSAVYLVGGIKPNTPLTITGDIYQTGGIFVSSNQNLVVEGTLSLAGGDFYAPDTPHNFTLTGAFTHTGGTYHQTQLVNGANDVGFPKAGGVMLNANGLDLGSTTVTLTADVYCAGLPVNLPVPCPVEPAVRHGYVISPTHTTGRAATITFFYRESEAVTSGSCAAMKVYPWIDALGEPLPRVTSYGDEGRLCGSDPQSVQVTGVDTFPTFILQPLHHIFMPVILKP